MTTVPTDTLRPEIIFGAGGLATLGELAVRLGGGSALIVTDRRLVEAGHVRRATDSLDAAGVTWSIFDAVIENPTDGCVRQCADAAAEFDPAVLIGLGGGSAIDTAKGCNFLHAHGGTMADYRGVHHLSGPWLPLIAVPTTAGTGSETQSFALISDDATGEKMACGDPRAMPAAALLDPLLTLTQPPAVAACSGIDALGHALESGVCTKRTEASVAYSVAALELLLDSLPAVLGGSEDHHARAAVQLGAAYAGMAIERSMLGAAHALANPLTRRYGVAHGRAVGWMLPHVMRYNAAHAVVAAQYRQLAGAVGLTDEQALIDRVEQLVAMAGMNGLPAALAGATDHPVDDLAAEAAGQWTATFNPRPVDRLSLATIYRTALSE